MEGYGLRVLVAEDDESTRYLISDVLSKAGYNVFPAVDGMVAIEELKKRHYDVVLTDYQMPRLNGLELLALSRELMPETPVILISCADLSLEQVAIERGAFAWIRKPVPVTQVLLIVRAAMDQIRSGHGDAGTDSGSSTKSPVQLAASIHLAGRAR
ncbi:MAG: response regulator [Nitrospirae bacterium]|nr:response regulator [Nitrospirota bacterium]MBU6480691.1 response regulator [Nitrospirota bacterium]MDE3041313.1 response regulator [Nitrospirota bacterium]MDE3048464.1 response regulator [Nitrospirota bacterium]MDE3221313.1 response regulator [Nitrospirota bacterium]